MEKLSDPGQAGAEIQVPPAMIEAGSIVVYEYREICDDAELALRVYIAMRAARDLDPQ